MLVGARSALSIGSKRAIRWRRPAMSIRQLAYPAIGQVRSHWTDRLPAIVRPSFWSELYPGVAKRWRERRGGNAAQKESQRKKGWNSATFFIWMAMLIGSQSINLLLLKNEYEVFSRKADAKIALLREVIEKLHRGEQVDVERALGTGDEVQEREWEEVLEEVANEDRLWRSKERKRQRRDARKAEREAQAREAKEAEEKAQASEGETET